MLRKRITTFIVTFLILIFFVAAAAIAIFLSQGRRIDGTEGVVLTSIINLNTLPEEVNVFINDKRVDRTDGRVENLDPGTITLRVEKDGYTTWEKQLTLQAGVVKDVNVQLFPKNLELTALTQININKAIFAKDSEYIFYSVLSSDTASNLGIWKLKLSRNLLNLTENKPTKVLTFDSTKASTLLGSDYQLILSKDNSRFVLYSPAIKLIEVYDANTGSQIAINNALISFPSKVDWFNGSSSLILLVNNLVYEYEISSKQLSIVTFDTQITPTYYVASGRIIYFNRTDGKYYAYKNKSSTELELFSKGLTSIIPAQIFTPESTEEVLAVLSGDKTLYFFDEAKTFQAAFKDVDAVLNVNAALTEYVLVKGDDLYSLYFEPTADNKAYSSTLKPLSTKKIDIEYSTILENSSSIAFIKKLETGKNTLTVMDKDGENSKDFFNDERLGINPIAISPNGSELYVILNEKSGESLVENLYKMILFK
ncbi:MAG: PEGA domain-containing protein [Candidatus Dojkabacteria bacterium]